MVKQTFVRDFLDNFKMMMENLPEGATVYFMPIETEIADKKYPTNWLVFKLEISAIVDNLICRSVIKYHAMSLLFSSKLTQKEEIQRVRQSFDAYTTSVKLDFANHKNLFKIEDGRILTPKETYKDA
jgi:hypothetical protein